METTGDLSEKLRNNTLNQVQETEKAVQVALKDLTVSMRSSLRNELHTLRQDMGDKLWKLQKEIHSALIQSTKQTALYSLICITTLGILCGGAALITGWSLSRDFSKQAMLKVEVMELEQSVNKLSTKNLWGVKPVQGQNGRFLVLPKGMKANTGWTVDGSPAIKLEE